MAAVSAVLAGGIVLLGRPGGAASRGAAGAASGERRKRGVHRSRRWLAAGAVLLLAAVALLWWRPGLRVPAAGDWVAAACDVGQGDAMVVRTGPAAAMVVDAGPDPGSLDSCLDSLRIETVDLLVISHAHADHYGGAEAAGDGRQVLGLAFSSAERTVPREVAGLAAGYGLTPQRLSRGMSGKGGAVQWQVLWPPASETPAGPGPRLGAGLGEGARAGTGPGLPLTENDASAVLLLHAAGLTFLFTGDIEEDAAVRLLHSTPVLREAQIDVLKVAHHGARNGGTALPAALRPGLALISVGADNTYGHPSPDMLQALQAAGAQVARTDLLGTFTLRTDGSRLFVDRLRRG